MLNLLRFTGGVAFIYLYYNFIGIDATVLDWYFLVCYVVHFIDTILEGVIKYNRIVTMRFCVVTTTCYMVYYVLFVREFMLLTMVSVVYLLIFLYNFIRFMCGMIGRDKAMLDSIKCELEKHHPELNDDEIFDILSWDRLNSLSTLCH